MAGFFHLTLWNNLNDSWKWVQFNQYFGPWCMNALSFLDLVQNKIISDFWSIFKFQCENLAKPIVKIVFTSPVKCESHVTLNAVQLLCPYRRCWIWSEIWQRLSLTKWYWSNLCLIVFTAAEKMTQESKKDFQIAKNSLFTATLRKFEFLHLGFGSNFIVKYTKTLDNFKAK